ncbi:MAG: DNA-binding protein [Rhodopirellula sp.]|uniref:Excisionase/Xis, DNA-binding domain protein n=1 Tax=Rhodopirellula europaea SH398 TaxID=1263868 RepID=M5S645_9BACT|nr:helix-turn-helix domain-containing protein [Rhodopirellula europaea]EMI23127.1 Excisionase/Xis, DNA-binding domain protein [Rhodopirellula europaea SH398]MAP09141.1 DNA-binding protein [Rhodopirellula sp.]MCR9208209.1 helix-turn-helix domain-containing protein [bacterium]
MASYLSLEDAAKQLGIPADKLIDLRSQGQVRGFRDGSSWKFPEAEIERLKDELPNMSGLGSGILAADGGGSKIGSVIGGDNPASDDSGLDLDIDSLSGGSDVNLIASDSGDGSDVTIVPGAKADSDAPLKIDLDDLNLSGSAISHDSGDLELESPTPGPKSDGDSDEFNLGSSLGLDSDSDDLSLEPVKGTAPVEGAKSQSDLSGLGGEDSDGELDLGDISSDEQASSLELMGDLDLDSSPSAVESKSHAGSDVLSELDLLAGDAAGSGLLSGSGDLLGSSLMSAESGGSSGVDDALADDDDLIIADDDDDLVVSGAGSDISIAGDSGINLMSPSDSGLSLESEPLDLAGSSISALDLGAELNEGSGTGSGHDGSGLVPASEMGSGIDFKGDDEFQLSASGIQIDGNEESASQVIEVVDSESVDIEEVDFDGADQVDAFDEAGDSGFAMDDDVAEADALDDPMDGDGLIDENAAVASAGAGVRGGYEVPFTLLQTIGLLLILCVMSLGGMLMTDLVRNMWSYAEPSAPVSALTDMLISVAGW